ncbi:MAG: hypothetical protein H0X33_06325 [Taibaiella sp.]|nr:hypothetical protein [Taibaiella sp.]
MKHTTLFISIIFALLFIAGCNKDTKTEVSTTMAAMVNANQEQFSQVVSQRHISSGVEIRITGVDLATGHNIELYFLNYIGNTGLYTIDTASTLAWYGTSAGSLSQATSGQIVLTKVSYGFMYGTFNFVTKDSTRIANGTFVASVPD